MRLIQFIPVMQSTPNSQSSHNCSFRLSQTKMCCWIQVSFSSQIKILCDLHNLFNTDPHPDPSFTSPFFCQQQNISSLKTDLQPRQMIRQPEGRGVVRKVPFRPVRRKSSAEDGFRDKESLRCDSEAQQNLSQWWKCDKIAQEGKKLARTDGKKATRPQGERDWKSRSAKWNKINQTHQHLKLHLSSIYCALFQIRGYNLRMCRPVFLQLINSSVVRNICIYTMGLQFWGVRFICRYCDSVSRHCACVMPTFRW